MSQDLRLVVFDVDGTLVDSQNDIVTGMTKAFDLMGMRAPGRADILATVGLSLSVGVARLAPNVSSAVRDRLVETYKQAYHDLRTDAGSQKSSPLYDGVEDTLVALHAVDPLLMGVATGKSRRGLDALLDAHDLRPYFVTQQCADDHPSKPHPSMLHSAMSEAGVNSDVTVMVGDTAFDMDMARAAGARFVGVTWGYHGRDRLEGADIIIDDMADLAPAILELG